MVARGNCCSRDHRRAIHYGPLENGFAGAAEALPLLKKFHLRLLLVAWRVGKQ